MAGGILVVVAIIAYVVYASGRNAGYKQGNQVGSQKGYKAGLLDGSQHTSLNEKSGGCLSLIILIATLLPLLSIIFLVFWL